MDWEVGDVLRVSRTDGSLGKIRYVLVGAVNRRGGICDDCYGFAVDERVEKVGNILGQPQLWADILTLDKS